MSVLKTPEEVLKQFEKMIFKFVWNATDRIKRKTLIGNKYEGGLKMLDIVCKNKALKASWAKRITSKNVNSNFINMYLQKQGLSIDYLIKCTNRNEKILKDYFSPGYGIRFFHP